MSNYWITFLLVSPIILLDLCSVLLEYEVRKQYKEARRVRLLIFALVLLISQVLLGPLLWIAVGLWVVLVLLGKYKRLRDKWRL